MPSNVEVKALWDKVVDQVKLKVIHPTLWKTLEMATPIIADGDDFVVGFAPADFSMSSNLATSTHKNAIEAALRELSGIPFRLQIVEGETVQDWKQVQVKETQAEAIREAAHKKQEEEFAVTRSWDDLMEMVGRKYASTRLRQLPQARAAYIEGALKVISETMDALMPSGSPTNELAERSLARILERVANLADVPATLIALELRRLRKE